MICVGGRGGEKKNLSFVVMSWIHGGRGVSGRAGQSPPHHIGYCFMYRSSCTWREGFEPHKMIYGGKMGLIFYFHPTPIPFNIPAIRIDDSQKCWRKIWRVNVAKYLILVTCPLHQRGLQIKIVEAVVVVDRYIE